MKEWHENWIFAACALQDAELVLEPADFAAHPVHKVPTYYFRMPASP